MDAIIDFRVRPPYKSLAELPLFRPREEDTAPTHRWSGLATGRGPCPSHRLKSMDLFLDEMAAAGVVKAVVPGRHAPGKGTVPNTEIAELVDTYPDRFIGFGSIGAGDLGHASAEIERFLAWGFKGATLEAPWFDPPRHFSDASLNDVYAACEEAGLVLMLTSSIYVGPDLSYSDPIHIQTVAERYPDLTIVISHAAWPNVMGLLGVAFRYPNVIVMPDLYGNTPGMPGRRDWIDAANSFLSHRMVYASAYPIRAPGESVAGLKSWVLPEEIEHRVLYMNAARILKLDD